RAHTERYEGIFSPKPLAKHARHPAILPAGGRSPGLYDPRRSGRNTVASLRHLQRIRIVREPSAARARGISRLRKISVQGARLERCREHQGLDRSAEQNPQTKPGAPAFNKPAVSSRRE